MVMNYLGPPAIAMVINLWVTTPLRADPLCEGVTHQIPCISDIYIMINNRSKIIIVK